MSAFTEALLAACRATVGIKETTRNSGPEIDKWLAYVRQPPGQPWCSAWCAWMHKIAAEATGVENPYPRTAGALRVWELTPDEAQEPLPAPGDVFVLDTGEPGGAGHVGVVEVVAPDGTIVSIEGNTNEKGSREGNAVVRQAWKPREGKRGRLVGFLSFTKLVTQPDLVSEAGLPPSPFA